MSWYRNYDTNDKAGQIIVKFLPKSCSKASTWAASQTGQTHTHTHVEWAVLHWAAPVLSPDPSLLLPWAWAANTSPLGKELPWQLARWQLASRLLPKQLLMWNFDFWLDIPTYKEPYAMAVLVQCTMGSLCQNRDNCDYFKLSYLHLLSPNCKAVWIYSTCLLLKRMLGEKMVSHCSPRWIMEKKQSDGFASTSFTT